MLARMTGSVLLRWRVLSGLLRPHLIAKGDEQRRHVLAVAVNLRKRGTTAFRDEAGRGDLELHGIRVGIGAADGALRRNLLHLDVGDGLTADVVVAAQECTGS